MSAGRRHIPKIKVLHVITNLETGGAERMLYRLLSVQRDENLDIAVISLIGPGKFGELIARLGIPFQSLGFSGIFNSLRGFVGLILAIYRLRPQVIHGWLIHGCVLATVALMIARIGCSELRKTRVIWGIRNSLKSVRGEKFGTWLCLQLGRYLSNIPVAITYNSEQGRRDYEAIGFSNKVSCVIPNGFELSAGELPPPPPQLPQKIEHNKSTPVIGHCARYHPMKGHLNLLEAAQLVCAHYPNALFVLAGRGVNEANRELANVIEKLDLQQNVLLLDEVSDIRSLAAYLDLHILPSLWGEGFPNAIGEMMQQGVPCIASDIGASRELIGDTGIVIPPGDRIALSSAIIEFLSQPEAAKERACAQAAERIKNKFGITSVIRQYQDLYLLAAGSIGTYVG